MMVFMSGQVPEAIQLVVLTAIVRLRDGGAVDLNAVFWYDLANSPLRPYTNRVLLSGFSHSFSWEGAGTCMTTNHCAKL